jgi:DUF3052 family protein
MGYDAACTIRFEGRTARGTAWLEHKDLVFRGPFRLAVPIKDITAASTKDGSLIVEFAGQTAEFKIGAVAPKWAGRILNPPSRLDKLGVKPDMKVLVVAFDDKEFVADVTRRGATIAKAAKEGSADVLFYGADRRDALERLPLLAKQIAPNGAIWVVRPKGQRAITEADVMAAGKRAGLVDVKVVSFSETHTAEKFVIPVARRAAPARSSSPSPRTRGSASSRART